MHHRTIAGIAALAVGGALVFGLVWSFWPGAERPAPLPATRAPSATEGEKAFAACISCHVIRDDEGVLIAGRAGRIGPNLYGITDARAGAMPGFAYSQAMATAGAAGLVWDEASFRAYVADPNGFLRARLDDPKARSKMAFQLRKTTAAQVSADLWAYLKTAAR